MIGVLGRGSGPGKAIVRKEHAIESRRRVERQNCTEGASEKRRASSDALTELILAWDGDVIRCTPLRSLG